MGDIEVAFRFGVSVVPLDEAVAVGWFGYDAGFLTEVVASCACHGTGSCRADEGLDLEEAVFAEDGPDGLVGAHHHGARVHRHVVGPAVEDVALGGCGLDADGFIVVVVGGAGRRNGAVGVVIGREVEGELARGSRDEGGIQADLGRTLSCGGIDQEQAGEDLRTGGIGRTIAGGVFRCQVDVAADGVGRTVDDGATTCGGGDAPALRGCCHQYDLQPRLTDGGQPQTDHRVADIERCPGRSHDTLQLRRGAEWCPSAAHDPEVETLVEVGSGNLCCLSEYATA